ncbi:hypothetical protein ROS1_44870 [Roseibium sp. ROS1]
MRIMRASFDGSVAFPEAPAPAQNSVIANESNLDLKAGIAGFLRSVVSNLGVRPTRIKPPPGTASHEQHSLIRAQITPEGVELVDRRTAPPGS